MKRATEGTLYLVTDTLTIVEYLCSEVRDISSPCGPSNTWMYNDPLFKVDCGKVTLVLLLVRGEGDH